MQHLIEQQLNSMITGKFEESWKLSEQLEINYPNDVRAKFNRGWLLMQQGLYSEGLKCLEYGRELGVYGDANLPENLIIWDKSDLNGKTVILYLETPVNESIMYARFATKIWNSGATCIVCCHESLHPMMYRIPGVSKCIDFSELTTTKHDFLIPSLKCISLFDCSVDGISNDIYLFARKESVDIWKSIIKSDKNKKIGIYWSDNSSDKNKIRFFEPANLLKICDVNDNFDYYSLQRQQNDVQLPEHISDLQHFIISMEDLIACIENLDLVITSSSSVGHLASAMGKPTWMILPILCEPLLAYGENHTPWYQNTTKLFRQKQFGEWDPVFDQIKTELNTL